MHVIQLDREDDFDGWRRAARGLLALRVAPADVVWQVGEEATDLFGQTSLALPADAPAFSVSRDFLALAQRAILHSDPQRFAILYALLCRLIATPRLMQDRADRQVRRVYEWAQHVGRDKHKMRAFVRFREVVSADGPHYVAWFEPDHHILRANAAFFVGRFTNRRWSILTPKGALHWDGHALSEGPPAQRSDAPAGDPVEDIWKTYYASIFNPARLMVGAMLKEMPKKYWKNMPETALIGDLVAGAQARESAMIDSAAMGQSALQGRMKRPGRS